MMELDLSKRSPMQVAPSRTKRLSFQSALSDSDWEVIRYSQSDWEVFRYSDSDREVIRYSHSD